MTIINFPITSVQHLFIYIRSSLENSSFTRHLMPLLACILYIYKRDIHIVRVWTCHFYKIYRVEYICTHIFNFSINNVLKCTNINLISIRAQYPDDIRKRKLQSLSQNYYDLRINLNNDCGKK